VKFKYWLINEVKWGSHRDGGGGTAVMGGGKGLSGLDFNTRVMRGKNVEQKIKDALSSVGIVIRPAGRNADMYDKIDGYLIDGSPVQIKYRDTGLDILFELIKPFDITSPLDNQPRGKDYRSKAVWFFILDPTGKTIYQIPTKSIRDLVDSTVKEIGGQPLFKPYTSGNGIQIRPVKDPSDGTPKVNAFIPPRAFQGIARKIPVNVEI